MKKSIVVVLAVVVLFVLPLEGWAQCAMCRATAESATENVSKGIGEGLNTGIVYLMLIPYLLLAIAGLVFFRKKIFAMFAAK